MDSKEYYHQVAEYFDVDASDFEHRYQENPVLQRIRYDFRARTEKFPFTKALEIGCGTGIDLEYFANKYPERHFYGIDVAPDMVTLAKKKISAQKLNNVHVASGTIEDLPNLFPDQKFDMIYIYFGALNTVYDLQKTAQYLYKLSTADATLVLTSVNRNYLMDIPLFLIKGRFKQAFARIRGRWKGYSTDKSLDSRCYSSSDIHNAFIPNFEVIENKGYSIIYPAWYRYNHLKRIGRKWSERLWNVDQWINRTPFWNSGEYSLYVLKPKKAPGKDFIK